MKDRAYVQSLRDDFAADLPEFDAVDDYHVRYLAATADDGRYVVIVSLNSDYPTHDDWFCSVYADEDSYTNADAPIVEYRHDTHSIDDILSIFS
jgi:hypothetical protein